MSRFADEIVRHWYGNASPGRFVQGLSGLASRWTSFRKHRGRNTSRALLGVPVVVIGNITVGGTGKTPLITYLVEELGNRGFKVGIVSRGQGGHGPFPCVVDPDTPSLVCGDEPLLLAKRCRVPVVVDPDRMSACKTLVRAHDLDIIFSDDGLQHYGMPRQIEIVVFDGQRGIGNGLLLPFGPLRESPDRLTDVDAIVVNGEASASVTSLTQCYPGKPVFDMHLRAGQWRDLRGQLRSGAPGTERRAVAVSGIGNPQRFFQTLRHAGLDFEARIFSDHHQYVRKDLADLQGVDVVLTEKDAVKIHPDWVEHAWVLPVRADLRPSLASFIADRLLEDTPKHLEFVE